MKWRVLITCIQLQNNINHYRNLFLEHGIEIELPRVTQQLNEAELCEIIDRFDGVIAGDDEFTAKVLEKASRLKVLVKWGIGVDGIDLNAAKQLNIPVFNTPDMFAGEVADVAIGYIILLARQLHKLDQSVRKGGWLKVQGISLANKTLGVIGLGSIGQAIVRRAVAMNMSVVGYDINPVSNSFIDETGLRVLDFDELLQASDFITLSCNLTPSNRHMLSQREFSLMKNEVYIINVARGPLIDETALLQALHKGKVAGAALDVFEQEPLPLNNPLHQFDSCIFGTHNGSNTTEAVMRVNELTIKRLLDALEKDASLAK